MKKQKKQPTRQEVTSPEAEPITEKQAVGMAFDLAASGYFVRISKGGTFDIELNPEKVTP